MIDRMQQHGRRIALAHDWLVGLRGGERVLDRLAQLFGPTNIYTLVQSGPPLTDAIAHCNVITSPLQKFPGASGRWRRHYLPLMPLAVGRIRVTPCDLLISTSSAVMKSIKPPTGTPHVCYCHSPARYIWEQSDDYAVGAGGNIRALGLRMVRPAFQRWDRRTADRVTKFIANSSHTAARIKRCFDREADVIYPPVRTDFFTLDEGVSREDWYLVVSALEPYKRTDIVIDAANRVGFHLKIVGEGTQMDALRSKCGRNVELLGRVDDERLRDFYRRAKALIFPQVEDFGIVAVEAQACGCPVIAYAAGGAMEIVTERTGVLFVQQDSRDILDAIRSFSARNLTAEDCRANALRFSELQFDRAMMKIVDEVLRS